MKFFFDENLSARLVQAFSGPFPGSAHVQDHGLAGAEDRVLWRTAARRGFVLVTKDEDFQRLSVLLGPPPKVIWIRLGNGSTDDVIALLESNLDRIRAFAQDSEGAFLSLG